MIYLDNAATTFSNHILKKVLPILNEGNPGSKHRVGRESKSQIETAREQVAGLLQSSPDNIIFTSSGSEANSLATLGLEKHLLQNNLRHIITTKYEHHSVLNAMSEMENRGFDVTYLDVTKGFVTPEDIEKELRDNTGLVSVMYVNNEIGYVNNIKAIHDLCQSKNIIFHSDCVQAAGFFPIYMNEDESIADIISISGHKIHAPKGIGCLCTTRKDLLSNILFGGEQENGLRPGTENNVGIVALGMAAQIATEKMDYSRDYVNDLAYSFLTELNSQCEQQGIYGVHLNSEIREDNIGKIINLRFDDVDGETLLFLLSASDVMVSSGAACSSNSVKPSHVLIAFGLSEKQARESIRISFSDLNTREEVIKAATIITNSVKCLREIVNKN